MKTDEVSSGIILTGLTGLIQIYVEDLKLKRGSRLSLAAFIGKVDHIKFPTMDFRHRIKFSSPARGVFPDQKIHKAAHLS